MRAVFALAHKIRDELYGTGSRRISRIWNTPARDLPENRLIAVLGAASLVYEKLLRIDQARAVAKRERLPVRVISIGNISCGGTGKTPLVLWICRYLAEIGAGAAILTRGYGRSGKGPARVKAPRESRYRQSAVFGDEPVLLAESLPSVPVWVGRRRAESGRAALSGRPGIGVIVLDDGFQHLALDRDLDIVLLDSRNPFGNGRTLPLGPLREPVRHLHRADALVLTHSDARREFADTKSTVEGLFPGKPIFSCRHRITGFMDVSGRSLPVNALADRKAAAFAGIAGPEGFFDSLSRCGVEVCARIPFPDHHRYSSPDLERVIEAASSSGAELIVTTAKDAVRLPPAFQPAVLVADMQLDFGPDESGFREFLRKSTLC